MAKAKVKKTNKKEGVQINLKESSIAKFTKRPVPSEEEAVELEEHMENEARDEEIDQGLTEIYQDDEGDLVDVRSLEKIRRKGFFLSLINFLFFMLILGGGAYYIYNNWYKNASLDTTTVVLTVKGDTELIAGEEYEYDLKYKNESRVTLNSVKINVKLPNNFILKETEPMNSGSRGLWDIGDIAPYTEGSIKIKGMMLGHVDDSGIFSTYMTYSPEGLSSEYKKESFLSSKIIDTGIKIDFDFYEIALVGETEKIFIRFSAMENNFINNFRLSLEPQENISNINFVPEEDGSPSYGDYASFTIDRPGIWEVDSVLDEERVVPVRFKVNDKLDDKQDLVFKFEKKASDGQYHEFYSETISLEIMKNNLNLALIINGERGDMGVNFGETLNYSIVYNNKGDSNIKDIVIMAVLDGNFLDWTSLDDKNGGREKGNTITWSKEEIPGLAEIKQDEEGVIDFSIRVLDFGAVNLEDNHEISSHARFSVGLLTGSRQEGGETGQDEDEADNKSNTIISKMNSDLDFVETIRYFNEDNIPVGSGPNPPQVGEKTTYKVYWKINNNLHELNKLGVSLSLPEYMEYEVRDRATVGSVIYSEETHEVTWNIGRLPTSVYQASAEFNVSLTPSATDKNKIMVLLPGSSVQAIDAETQEGLSQESKAKTTKLEDDEIGMGDGMIE